VAVRTGRVRRDLGKLIMVPACALVLVADLTGLDIGRVSSIEGALRSLGALLVLAFYVLLIWCYLRRRPAVATSASVTAHIAAVAATWLPFALPLLRGPQPGAGQQALADVLLVCGMTWALWSLRFLGRSVSVLAQARDVVDQGPYRWVRHPLYAGEIVSSLGVAIAMNSAIAVAAWVLLCCLQAYRALREEQVLLQALPAYADYRSRTAAFVPGVFWRRRAPMIRARQSWW